MEAIAKRFSKVNSHPLYTREYYPIASDCRGMEKEALIDVVRQWLLDMIEERCSGNQSEFARQTGIKQVDVNKALNRKGRGVSWGMIARISCAKGYPPVNELLGDIARRAGEAQTNAVIRGEHHAETPRERLKKKYSSEELQLRASLAARRQEDQQHEPQERPQSRPAAPATKKTDQG